MFRSYSFLLLVLAGGVFPVRSEGPEVVFRSDVSLVRVDAHVVDRENRVVGGLRAEDFVLREEGRPQEIRNFVRESMPVDVVLLLDVSGSMRPHVESIAEASHQALNALGREDRVAILVFDRETRLRMPFRSSRKDVSWALDSLLREETFNGGTDITRGMLDAIEYVGREGRRDARRAVVILTDDETERERDEAGVMDALVRYDVVMSSLLAPSMYGSSQFPASGSWPTSSRGGWGSIFGRRGSSGGVRLPGGPIMTPRTQSAGTAEISHDSGGDSMPVDEAQALQTTLERIRQRYALHFNVPEGVAPGQQRRIDVALADAARRRYPQAEVRFRRLYLTPSGAIPSTPSRAAISPSSDDADDPRVQPAVYTPGSSQSRRTAVTDADDMRRTGPLPDPDDSNPPPAACPAPAASSDSGGFGQPGSSSRRRTDRSRP